MAADVVVTLVSVVPVVLSAPLDVCGVVVTAAVTLELTVIVSIVAEVLVVREVMLFDPPAAVAMVVENIKEKNINDIKDLKIRCASTTDISMGMRGEIQVTGGHISEGL